MLDVCSSIVCYFQCKHRGRGITPLKEMLPHITAKFRTATKIRTPPSPAPRLTWISLLIRVTSLSECAYEVSKGSVSVDEFPVRPRLGYPPAIHDDYLIALGEVAYAVGHQDSGLEGVRGVRGEG